MLLGLGHADLVCADLERSLEFYAAVLGPLGLEPPHLVDGERGEQIHYLRFPVPGSGSLGLRQALEEQTFELYAPGLHHLAFAVETNTEVDAVHDAAVAAGAEILHAPRLWPEYYATFFLDPDGFRIEVASAREIRAASGTRRPRRTSRFRRTARRPIGTCRLRPRSCGFVDPSCRSRGSRVRRRRRPRPTPS